MTRSPNYMSGIETYLYNDIVHNDNMSFVLYHSDENDNRNQSGILNLLKEEVSFIIEVIYSVNILNVIIIYFLTQFCQNLYNMFNLYNKLRVLFSSSSKSMKGSLYYMSGLETYLYNDIIHDNNTALVRKISGENDNLNQNGILNLYNLNLKKYGVYILRVKH